jgi:hypothetical protein
MNQDNNFNMQGNNGMSNNQNVNSQQPIYSQQPQNFQQPMEQMSMQQPEPQSTNTFESANMNNQNFDNKPPKKTNLGLIIGIVVIIAIVGVGIILGSKLLSNDNNNPNTNDNDVIESNNNESNKTDDTNEKTEMITASNYFDTSKFDSTKFSGMLYDDTGYSVSDLLTDEKYNYDYNNSINIFSNNLMRYSLTSDKQTERSIWSSNNKGTSDEYIYKLIEVIGHPSTYCESYSELSADNSTKGYQGTFHLFYNYGDYVLQFLGHDFRGWEGYDHIDSPSLSSAFITKKEDFTGTGLSEYTCYGDKSIIK